LSRSVSTKTCTDLVQESQCAVALSKVTHLFDGTNTATHGVDTLKRNDLRDGLGVLSEFLLKIFQAVVFENDALRSRVAHALNHGCVVHLVRENDAPGELGAQGGERRVVGNVARGKHQCTVLAMESGKLILQGKVHGGIPSNVTCTTRAMAVCVQSAATDGYQSASLGNLGLVMWDHSLHSFEHNRVVPHPQIIVGAPNFDLVGDFSGVSERELLSHPVDVVEVAVGVIRTLLVKFLAVELFVIEELLRRLGRVSLGLGVVERAPRRFGRHGLSGGRAGGLGPLFLGVREFLRHTGSRQGSRSVGTLFYVGSRAFLHVNALLLVKFFDVDVPSHARIVGDDLARPGSEDGAHDGAPGGLFGQTGERRVVGRSASA